MLGLLFIGGLFVGSLITIILNFTILPHPLMGDIVGACLLIGMSTTFIAEHIFKHKPCKKKVI